jgi:hypothetical protein
LLACVVQFHGAIPNLACSITLHEVIKIWMPRIIHFRTLRWLIAISMTNLHHKSSSNLIYFYEQNWKLYLAFSFTMTRFTYVVIHFLFKSPYHFLVNSSSFFSFNEFPLVAFNLLQIHRLHHSYKLFIFSLYFFHA